MSSSEINDYLNRFNTSNIQSPTSLIGGAGDLDTVNPLSFKEWLRQHTFIKPGKEFLEYNMYLKKWYSSRGSSKENQLNKLKNDYIDFINELSILFKDDPDFKYIIDIDYDDNVDFEYAIPFFTKKIKEICFYIINKRESSKKAKIKYNMAGSTQAIEKLYYQYILQAFTQKNSLVNVPEFSGYESFPSLSSVSNSFKITVEELNDEGNYFDKNPSVDYTTNLNLSSYFENLDYNDSYDWIFNSGSMSLFADNPLFFVLSSTLEEYGVDSSFNLPYSAIDLSDETVITLNQENEALLTKKYAGNDFYILTGGYYILNTSDFTYDLSRGNNWFYWPSGESFFELDENEFFDPISLQDTSLKIDGAVSDSNYTKADKIFIENGGEIIGSWFRYFKSTTETQNMTCSVGRDISVEFKFPYPDYGLIGDGAEWTGRGISNLDSRYDILDSDSKSLVDDIYWAEISTSTEQICSIAINDSSAVDSGAFPSVYYKDADKISKRTSTNRNKVNDLEPNSVYKDGFEYAWLYKFLKTDLPVRSGKNEYQFPIERIENGDTKLISIDSEFCSPITLSSVDVNSLLGSRSGVGLFDSDILYKLSGKGGYPVECAFLKGFNIVDSIDTTTNVTGEYGNAKISDVVGVMQVGLTFKAKPDAPETFLWQDENTALTALNISYKPHQEDCPFLLQSEHKSIYKQKDTLEFEFEYPWTDCKCKSVLYSPIGHPGETFNEYGNMADIIILDTQDPKPYSLKEWRDDDGNDYNSSNDFAWFKRNNTNVSNETGVDLDVGIGSGSWVTGSGEPFILQKGRQYKYIRSSLGRSALELASNYVPPLVVSYNYNHTYTPIWKKAILGSDSKWVETTQESDMILNPSDYIMYDHFESNFYCIEYQDTYKEYTTLSQEATTSNPNNDFWVNNTLVSVGIPVEYQWPSSIYEGVSDDVPTTTVLASDLSAVTWFATIINEDGSSERYTTTLSPESKFTVIGYQPQEIRIRVLGRVIGGLAIPPSGDNAITDIRLNSVKVVDLATVETETFSGAKLNQTIYSDTINFMINLDLYGWDYDNFKYDGISKGAKPIWGQALDDDSYATKFKGVREWGYGLREADDYTFIHQPKTSHLTFDIDDTITYLKKNKGFNWIQPVDFIKNDATSDWCDLIVESEKTSPLSSYLFNQDKELVIYPTSNKSNIKLNVGDYVNYWANADFTWTQQLTDSSDGIPPYGGTYIPYASSMLIEADVPYANLTNRNFPSIAIYPIASNFYTDRDSGSFFNHKGLGLLTYVNKDFTNIVNPLLSSNQFYSENLIFKDPDVFASNDLGLSESRGVGPIITSENDSRWMKGSIVEGYKSGGIVVEKDYKEFTPYQVKEENIKNNISGLLDVNFDLDPWTNKLDDEWEDDVNWPPNFRKQYPTKQWNFDLNYFVKRQYITTYNKSIKLTQPFICEDNDPCSKIAVSKEYNCTTCLGPKYQKDISCLYTSGLYDVGVTPLTSDGGLLMQVNGDFFKLNYIPLYVSSDPLPSFDPYSILYGEHRDDVSYTYFGMVSICVNKVEFYTPVYRSNRTNCEVSNIVGVYDFSDQSEFTQFGHCSVIVNEVDARLIELYTKGPVPTTSCEDCTLNTYISACVELEFDPISAYHVEPLSDIIFEGNSVDFEVSTFNVADDTVLYWNVVFDDTNNSDFVIPVSGEVVIDDSEGTFTVFTNPDLTVEGSEDFRAEILVGSNVGEVKATSTPVTIIDTTPTTTTVCPTGPSMLLTVTGASGTVNWCGETWNLPAESGTQKEVCPTTYNKSRNHGTRTIYTVGPDQEYFKANHQWVRSDLVLNRSYSIWKFTDEVNWQLSYMPTYNGHGIIVKGDFSSKFFSSTPNSLRPMTNGGWSNSFTNTGPFGLVAGIGGPTYSDYSLVNEFFGSTVNGGITYEWEKGSGW